MRQMISIALAAIMTAGYLSVGALALSPRSRSPLSGTYRQQTMTERLLQTGTEESSTVSPEVFPSDSSSAGESSSVVASSSQEQSSSSDSFSQKMPALSLQTSQMNESVEPCTVIYSVGTGGTLYLNGTAYSSSGSIEVENGASISVSATPDTGYILDSLLINSESYSVPAILTVTSSATISAVFQAVGGESSSSEASSSKEETVSYPLNYSSPENGSLSVTCGSTPVSSGSTLEADSAITVTAAPADGYVLSSLTVNGAAIHNGDRYTIDSATTVSASFTKEEVSYTVTFTESSAYGNLAVTYDGSPVLSGANLPENAVITITATPADGYVFSSMRINTTDYTDSSVSYTLTGDTAISATFSTSLSLTNTETTSSTYTVTVPSVSSGLLSVRGYVDGVYKTLAAGTTAVDANSTLTVTADAASGYKLTYLAIGGSTWSPGTSSAYTQSATVTGDTVIAVTFTAIAYTGSAGYVTQPIAIYNEDGEVLEDNSGDEFEIDDIASNGKLTLDGLLPNQTFYIKLGETGNDLTTILNDGDTAAASQLADDDLFKLSIDKDGSGKSLISSITQVGEKRLDGDSVRGSYLKIVLRDSTTTDELKATAEITFKAKKTLSASSGDEGTWSSGEYAVLNLIMWINNSEISGSDGEADTGDSVYFSPESDEVNTFIWGDDRAAIEFTADDDAEDFYARLSTKSDVDIYTEYGDPVDADLWFYNFVGNPTVPSTSRAALTLGIPWDEDDDDYPDPEDCYIYELDSDGSLSDVTERFTYSEDSYAIDGWTVKTRVLGTYIVSDTELDIDSQSYEVECEEEETADDSATGTANGYESMVKVNPSTGNGGFSYTPVTVPVTAESTQAAETPNIKVAKDSLDLKSAGHSDADLDTENAEHSAQEDTFPWAGALLATALVLAGSITGGYFLYRRMHP